MIDFSSDILAVRDNFLTRLDSMVKFLFAVELLVCVVLSQHGVFPLVVLAGCVTAMLGVKVPLPMVGVRMTAPVVMVSVLVALQSVLRGTTPLWAFHLGAWKVVVTQEGLHAGLLSGTKVFSTLSVLFLLSLVTPMHEIFRALRWLRMPEDWLEIASLMYRYLFNLLDFAQDMTAAQKLRLGYKGVRRGVKSMQEMMGTVVIRSVDQAMRTHEAMVLRGYRGSIPCAACVPCAACTQIYFVTLSLLTLGLYYLLERNPF